MREEARTSRLLDPYVPRCLLESLARAAPEELMGVPFRTEGAFLFCDVSGFTPLSEKLGLHGRAGTEELTLHLNAYFDAVIKVLFRWGGDVVKFGGDALTVFFERSPEEPRSGAMARAAECALEVLKTVARSPAIDTRWGRFPIGMKIGLASGPCLTGLVGAPPARLDLVVAGTALDRTALAEHHAPSAGECIVAGDPDGHLPSCLNLEPRQPGFARLISVRRRPSPPPAPRGRRGPVERMRPFILPAVWEQVLSGDEALLSEHRPVTTVFVGFPGLDYEEGSSLASLQDYTRRLLDLAAEHGGTFNRLDMGDKGSKALVFFGAPEKHENDEERAVAFALALRRMERDPPSLGRHRIGISTGLAYCGVVGSPLRKDYTVMGDCVNVAARLMAAAGEDGILATAEVRTACRDRFRWGAFRGLALKGKSGQVRVSSPLGLARRRVSGGQHRSHVFVGRGRETSRLKRLLASSRRGSGTLALVTGESGIGKTALLEHFLGTCLRRGERAALSRGSSVAGGPHGPWPRLFADLLRGSAAAGRESLSTRWKLLLPDQEEFLGLGLEFLGFRADLSPAASALEPGQRREKTEDLLARTLSALSEAAPLVVALDDLDEAGGASLGLLEKLLSLTRNRRILFLATAREVPKLSCGARQVGLGGLSAEETEALALAALRAQHLQRDTARFLFERSRGNPLHLLELIHSLKERGDLNVDASRWARWKPETAAHVPRNVEGLLLSRMDQLPQRARNVLKVASVLGMRFDLGLLHEVLGAGSDPGVTERQLEGLSGLGLRLEEAGGAPACAFAHEALREAVYDSLTVAHGRHLHAAAARALERRRRPRADPALLAHHYGLAENWEKSFRHGLGAARAAHARYAFAEGLRLYRSAEESAGRAGSAIGQKDLLAYAECAMTAGDNVLARRIVDGLLSAEGDEGPRLEARLLSVRICDAVGDFAACAEQAGMLEETARSLGDTKMILEGMRCRASSLFRLARVLEAQDVAERALALAKRKRAHHEGMLLETVLAGVLWQKGDFQSCLASYESALAAAEREKSHLAMARVLSGMSNALREMGRLAECETAARRALAFSNSVGSVLNISFSVANLISGLVQMGRAQDALSVLEENREVLEHSINPYVRGGFLNQQGTIHFCLSNYSKALLLYKKCHSLAVRSGNSQGAAYARYNIGNTLGEMGKSKAALPHLCAALRAFRSLEDVAWFSTTAKEILIQLEREKRPVRSRRIIQEIERTIVDWGRPDLLKLLPVSDTSS